MSFTTTHNKGFRMEFDNGFSISVQWGTMNYCERKNLMSEHESEMKVPMWASVNAEIAIFNVEGEMLEIGKHDTVIGWLLPDEVSKVMAIVSSSKTENEINTKIKSLNL